MATLRAFIGLSVVAVLVHAARGATYNVGGSSGWGMGTNYSSWAASIKFKTGDSLTFAYGVFHSVLEVSKDDYDSCSARSPLTTSTDGNTTVKLLSPGKRYFICGTPGHCSAGMKIKINTVAATADATPPPPSPVIPPVSSPSKAASRPVSPSNSPSSEPTIAPVVEPSKPKASELAATVAPTPQQSAAILQSQKLQNWQRQLHQHRSNQQPLTWVGQQRLL